MREIIQVIVEQVTCLLLFVFLNRCVLFFLFVCFFCLFVFFFVFFFFWGGGFKYIFFIINLFFNKIVDIMGIDILAQ